MEWRCAGCSIARFAGMVCPNISARITIRCFDSTNWGANLRILEVTEIKTVPYVPLSHPLVERLIGTIRREYLDRVLFWTTVDLERKLSEFRDYYDQHRTHAALHGKTPIENRSLNNAMNFKSYRWMEHCRGAVSDATSCVIINSPWTR